MNKSLLSLIRHQSRRTPKTIPIYSCKPQSFSTLNNKYNNSFSSVAPTFVPRTSLLTNPTLISTKTTRRFFTSKVDDDKDDLYSELHAEFENEFKDINNTSEANTTSSGIFGNLSMELGEMEFPNIALTNTIDSSWVTADNPGNPFTFPLLDITSAVYEHDTTNNTLTSHASADSPFNIEDRPIGEIYESFANISRSLNNPQQDLQSALDEMDDKEMGDMDGRASSDPTNEFEDVPDDKRTRSKHHRIKFDPPIVIRHVVPDSILSDTRGVFCAPISIGSEDMPKHFKDLTAPPPPLRTLNRASLTNARYDSYISGNDGRMLFFSSNINTSTIDTLGKNEIAALERHHVVTLSKPPKLVFTPTHLARMQATRNNLLGDDQSNKNADPNAVMSAEQADGEGFGLEEPFSHVLELVIDSATATYSADCPLGVPSPDKNYRAREVDFLIRNAIFGLTLPAPIPPQMQTALMEDLRTTLPPAESQKRREVAARMIVALYGKGSTFASIQSPLQYPCAKTEFIENNPHNLVYYDDPSKHFTGEEDESKDLVFESIFGDIENEDHLHRQHENPNDIVIEYDEDGNPLNVDVTKLDDLEYESDESASESDVEYEESSSSDGEYETADNVSGFVVRDNSDSLKA